MISKVEKKGRVVIPAGIRRKLALVPGSALEWTLNETGVSIVKLEPKSRRKGSFLEALKQLGQMPAAPRSLEKVSYPEA